MMTEDRGEWHVWNWANHMHGKGSSHLEHRNSASSGIGQSHGTEFDTMVEDADKRCADATDACIDSLSPNGKASVYARHLGGPWMLPSGQLGIFYRSAVINIARRLDRMGIA